MAARAVLLAGLLLAWGAAQGAGKEHRGAAETGSDAADREREEGIKRGQFQCGACNSSRDCGVEASSGRHQQDTAWRLWRSDGHYVDAQKEVRLCIRKWMAGCNGPQEPTICNMYTEVCSASQAAFDPAVRRAPHEVCSSKAFMSPASVTLIITIPFFLCLVSLVAVVATLRYSFANNFYQCPVALQRAPVIGASACLVAFSTLTFFSPHFACGIVGMFVGILAIIAHTATSVAFESIDTFVVSEPAHDYVGQAKRWLLASAVGTFFLVSTVWSGFNTTTRTTKELGQDCVDFYSFFEVDQRLAPPVAHPTAPRALYWGYCEREYIEDTRWNLRAVFLISLGLGALHLHTWRNIVTRQQEEEEDQYVHSVPGTVAGGPTAFLSAAPKFLSPRRHRAS